MCADRVPPLWCVQDKLDELVEAQKEEETGDDENGSEASMQQTLTSRKRVTIGHFEKTVASLQSDIKEVHDQQMDMADRFQHDLNSIKSLLKELIFQQQQQQFSHAGEIM